jgi:hypothetical protein
MLPSRHGSPAGLGVWTTPETGLQESKVQGFPSLTLGGGPATHVPVVLQASTPSHGLPFEQLVPAATFVCETPFTGWQESVVQGFPSSRTGGEPATHDPELQVSAPLHTVVSGQAVPFGFAGFEQVPVPALHVPAL